MFSSQEKSQLVELARVCHWGIYGIPSEMGILGKSWGDQGLG